MARRRAKAILLDTDFSGKEVNVSIESGFCNIDVDKNHKFDFFLDRTRPIKVGKDSLISKSTTDLYILSWKSLVPLELELRKEVWEKKDVSKNLKNENFTESEIERIMEDINKKEREGFNMDYFVYKSLEPVTIEKGHWAYTLLPTILRDTIDMRFLKSLKQYTEHGKGGIGGKGIGLAIGLVFMAFIVLYSLVSAGVFKPA